MADQQNERSYLIQLQKHFEEKDFSAALTLAEKSLKLFPFSFQIKLFYTKILKSLGRYDDAKSYLADLDKQYPYNISILMELAATLYFLKEYQESLIFYNRILFLDSFNEQAKKKVEEIQRLLDSRFRERLDETHVDERNIQSDEEDARDIAKQPTAVIPDEDEEEEKNLEEAEEPEEPVEGSHDVDFITESSAQLYLKQGLKREAIQIYRKLYEQTGDIRFMEKLQEIDQPSEYIPESDRVIKKLEQFLERIRTMEM